MSGEGFLKRVIFDQNLHPKQKRELKELRKEIVKNIKEYFGFSP